MKKLVVFLGAALLAVSILAVTLWQRLDESRNQIAQLQVHQQQTAEIPTVTAAAAMAAQPAPTTGAAASKDCPVLPAAATQGDTRTAAQRPNAALLDGAKQILSTEQGRAMVQPAIRGMIASQFKDVGKALGLSPEQEEKLIDLLARQQTELSAASMDLLTGNEADAGARREMERKVQDMQRANETELTTMLGAKYPQLQEFGSTAAVRTQVTQLNAMLAASGSELSDAQSKSLVATLAAEQKRITTEANANPAPAGRNRQEALELQLQRTLDSNRQMVEAASRHLNTQQLDSYRTMLDQQADMVKRVLGAMGSSK